MRSARRLLRRRPPASLLVAGWALLLAVALLGRALGPGYTLSYDMVWVPDLAVRPDVWGLSTALPRAVPSDAVVAVLDQIVPGSLLQKLALGGPLVAGGLGAARLLPAGLDGLVPRLVAVGLWQWNPFVIERLLLGQWTVLLAYGGLPWLLLMARRWADGPRRERLPGPLWLLVPLGSLSPSAGIATAVGLVLAAAGRGRRLAVLAVVAAGNAPWMVAALLHAGSGTTEAAGATAFALHGEGSLPAPLAALSLGGVWNVQVVPGSRLGPLGWVATVVIVVLVGVGAAPWWRAAPARERVALLACWALGWGLGVLTWAAPGPMGWAEAHVPGVALLRDGGRLLVLCAPLLVVVGASGAAVLWGALRRRSDATVLALAFAGAALSVLPLALLPDAVWGGGARLHAVAYPADYPGVRRSVAAEVASGSITGDLLVLPLSAYRAPAWNDGEPVLDPLPRYLSVDVLASDILVVGGRVVSGEDPRVAEAARALGEPDPAERARALAAMGVGAVIVEEDAGAGPEVAGRVVTRTPSLEVLALPARAADRPRPQSVPSWWVVALTPAWLAFAALPAIGLAEVVRGAATLIRRRRRRAPALGA